MHHTPAQHDVGEDRAFERVERIVLALGLDRQDLRIVGHRIDDDLGVLGQQFHLQGGVAERGLLVRRGQAAVRVAEVQARVVIGAGSLERERRCRRCSRQPAARPAAAIPAPGRGAASGVNRFMVFLLHGMMIERVD